MNLWAIMGLVGVLISLSTIPFILLSEKRPAGMLAWVWAVLLFPFLGPFCYVIFGNEKIYRRHLRKKRNPLTRRNRAEKQVIPDQFGPEERGLSLLLSELNLYPSGRYDEAELLVGAGQFYPALEDEIRRAKVFIHIEFFIWRNDIYGKRFVDLLAEAARRGVKVRIIADEMGCIGLPRGYFKSLEIAGGRFTWFNALHVLQNRWTFSLRNHRKLQIVDGRAAFVGGMNIGLEYMGEDPERGHWKDIQIRVTGAVVRTLMLTFEEDWFFATQEKIPAENSPNLTPFVVGENLVQVVEDGPDSSRYPMILSLVALLQAARQRIWLSAGYFFPQEPILSALKMCAARGVDVRILVPIKTDHPYVVKGARSYYEELLGYGVKIYEYDYGTHHAKTILMDESWLSVGSANLDIRSMRLNFELNLILHSPALSGQLGEIFVDDFKKCREIKLEVFQARPTLTRLVENSCRLLGPVL